MNCFQNYNLAIEWFKLGVELNPNEVQCLIDYLMLILPYRIETGKYLFKQIK